MKKHLVILCGIYYPDPSPTGLCAKRFAEILLDNYDIDVICISDNARNENLTLPNEIRIHTLIGAQMSAAKRATGFEKLVLHTFNAIQMKTRLLGNLSWFRSRARKELLRIQKQHPINSILSICSPFAAHCATMDFLRSHPNVHWCGYTVDPYATLNRIRPVGYSFKHLVDIEHKVFEAMNEVLLSEEIFENRKDLFVGIEHCHPLPYLLPEMRTDSKDRRFFCHENINCVYAGSFHKTIRNPKSMLNAFSKLKCSNIFLHLFFKGCESIVDEYTSQYDNIVQHECVSSNEIAQVYRDADVLVSVGNSIPEFLPSKTFEYIASCKPIIHFYLRGCLNPILSRYPAALQVEYSDDNNCITSILDFILTSKAIKVDIRDIFSIYAKNSKNNVASILKTSLQ